MPIDLINECIYPGIEGISSLTYTCSHGITPGTIQVTTFPQHTLPEKTGDLTIGDGLRRVTFKNVRVVELDGSITDAGTSYTIALQDRRWKWRNNWGGLGGVRGRPNRTDARGKLVPWDIRSPIEMAEYLLDQMGETEYDVTLPDGLNKAFGANLDRYLRLGENFPPSNTNPPFVWDYTPPSEALARLCDYFGARIIYQPVQDRILIAALGTGTDQLPDWPCELIAPSLTVPAAPKSLGVYGSPIKIQSRWRLEPVGEEWDGSIVPIDQLTYAPKDGPDKKRLISSTYSGNTASITHVGITVTWTDANGNYHSVTVTTGPGGSLAAAIAALIFALTQNPEFAADFTASAGSGGVDIVPKNQATDYRVTVDGVGWDSEVTQEKAAAGRTWKRTPPPHFRNALATDRLSKMEAVGLAQKSVFKYYRIAFVDPETGLPGTPKTTDGSGVKGKQDGVGGVNLPWFGKLKRVQQITLLPTKVEQAKPQPRIEGGVNKGNPIGIKGDPGVPGQGILPEFYNGESRDQLATVRGSIYNKLGDVFWNFRPGGIDRPVDMNTRPTDRVFVGGTVTQSKNADQLYIFNDFVYVWDGVAGDTAWVKYPELTLETACIVTDEDTDQVVRYFNIRELLGGDAPEEWHAHEDLILTVVGEYEDVADYSMDGTIRIQRLNHLKGWHFGEGDKEFTDAAAQAYLEGHAKKYVLTDAELRHYIGVRELDPDGCIQQVTWEIPPDGRPVTKASRNSEHSPIVPTYPQRRRPELLPPNKVAAETNRAEGAAMDKLFPPPESRRR